MSVVNVHLSQICRVCRAKIKTAKLSNSSADYKAILSIELYLNFIDSFFDFKYIMLNLFVLIPQLATSFVIIQCVECAGLHEP